VKEKVIIKVRELLHNKNNLIVLVLLGVLLFVITLPIDGGKSSKDGLTDPDNVTITESGKNGAGIQEGTDDLQVYCSYLEEKLAYALSMIEGAGKVEVMISFQTTKEAVVLKEQTVSRSGTEESDSQGGNRKISSFDSDETVVYNSVSGNSEPYVIKVLQPKVEGIIVIAEGAGSGRVSKNISDAIQSLFGLEAHKITIVKMETP